MFQNLQRQNLYPQVNLGSARGEPWAQIDARSCHNTNFDPYIPRHDKFKAELDEIEKKMYAYGPPSEAELLQRNTIGSTTISAGQYNPNINDSSRIHSDLIHIPYDKNDMTINSFARSQGQFHAPGTYPLKLKNVDVTKNNPLPLAGPTLKESRFQLANSPNVKMPNQYEKTAAFPSQNQLLNPNNNSTLNSMPNVFDPRNTQELHQNFSYSRNPNTTQKQCQISPLQSQNLHNKQSRPIMNSSQQRELAPLPILHELPYKDSLNMPSSIQSPLGMFSGESYMPLHTLPNKNSSLFYHNAIPKITMPAIKRLDINPQYTMDHKLDINPEKIYTPPQNLQTGRYKRNKQQYPQPTL